MGITRSQVKCSNCSKLFLKPLSEIKRSKTGRHFCSRSCSATFNNVGIQRNPPKSRKCKKCNKTFFNSYKERRTVFCSNCSPSGLTYSDLIKERTLKEYYQQNSLKDKHPSWRSAPIRGLCRSWNKDLQKQPCQNCGYSKHVELCHIKPVSSFSDDAKLKTVNSPDNLLVLCRNCHWEFDHNLLELESIPQRN